MFVWGSWWHPLFSLPGPLCLGAIDRREDQGPGPGGKESSLDPRRQKIRLPGLRCPSSLLGWTLPPPSRWWDALCLKKDPNTRVQAEEGQIFKWGGHSIYR